MNNLCPILDKDGKLIDICQRDGAECPTCADNPMDKEEG